jgi:hypothetical protein
MDSIEKTELDQVLAKLHWQEEFTVGAGIDVITGGTMGSALKPFKTNQHTSKSSKEDYLFIKDESDLTQEIETSASGKYNVEGATISGSASYLGKIKYSELSITLIAKYESTYDGYDEAEKYEFTEDAQKLVADPEKFRNAYGDYFISGGRRSSRFTAVYVCTSSSASSMSEFKASFGGSAPEVFSAEGSVRFNQSVQKSNISTSVNIFMEGYQGTPPSGQVSPDQVMAALEWFKKNEQGIILWAKLKHYSTINVDIPRTINVTPDVFVALQKLYSKVLTIQSCYAALPTYYQKHFKDKYNDVTIGVKASQSILPVKPDERFSYQGKADELLSALDAVSERMDFYNKVRAMNEQDTQEVVETASGAQIWSYGFSTYSKSPSVTIQQWQDRYHADWQIGWRERTFEFGPDDSKLIVGWQVISNWGDGTNGSWNKATDRILLTNHAAAHVKSQYDRGCDWTFRVFYVDAMDYQFGN